jgi:uncharacterized protein (TIGR02594 family)
MQKWMELAKAEIGVKERAGKAINPKIKAYYEDAGHPYVKDDAVPWCAAFVGAMLVRAGLKGTGALTARSYLTWGKPLKKPVPGAIMVFRRGNSEWQGHAGFYVTQDDTHYHILGGNQSNSVSIARYSKDTLLGIRWPSTFAKSRTVAAQAVAVASTFVGVAAETVSLTVTEVQPVVDRATSIWDWAVYVSLGLSLLAALATLYFRWQAREDGKYSG